METAENKANQVVLGLVVGGGLVGALVGVVASRLYIRADQQTLEAKSGARAAGPVAVAHGDFAVVDRADRHRAADCGPGG